MAQRVFGSQEFGVGSDGVIVGVWSLEFRV
jgi:hypothetical protein